MKRLFFTLVAVIATLLPAKAQKIGFIDTDSILMSLPDYKAAIEKLDAADIRRLYSVSADNLYQIRRRLGARFRTLLEQTMRDMDDSPPSP